MEIKLTAANLLESFSIDDGDDNKKGKKELKSNRFD